MIADIRGKGLLIGVKWRRPTASSSQRCATEQLLSAGGGDNCVRLLPPLNLTRGRGAEAMRGWSGPATATRTALAPRQRERPREPASGISSTSRELEARDLRAILEDAARRSAGAKGRPTPTGRSPARPSR